jgi:hypothetical protein
VGISFDGNSGSSTTIFKSIIARGNIFRRPFTDNPSNSEVGLYFKNCTNVIAENNVAEVGTSLNNGLIAVGTLVNVHADSVTIPSAAASAEGNQQGSFFDGTRFQQAYRASLFSTVNSPALEISHVRFRVDPNAPSFANSPEFEVRLSTTAQNPDSLNPAFAANTGANEVVGLPRSVISWSGNPGLSFDAVIPLPNRFVYKPSDGNLLFDISVYNRGSNPTAFDGENKNLDGISLVLGGATSPLGTPETFGFVTQFTFIPVPEPSAGALTLLGMLAILRFKNKNVTFGRNN